MREIEELKPDQLLETLPPHLRQIIKARKLRKERARKNYAPGDLRRKYPMGGYCGLCGTFAERVYPMNLDLCPRCTEKVVSNGSELKIVGKRIFWAENPVSWNKIRCEANCGDHKVLHKTSFQVCPRCAQRTASRMNEVQRIERVRS